MHQTAQKYAYANIQKIKSKKKTKNIIKKKRLRKFFLLHCFLKGKTGKKVTNNIEISILLFGSYSNVEKAK